MRTKSTSLSLLFYGLGTYLPSLFVLSGVFVFTRMVSSTEYGYFSLWSAIVLTLGSILTQWLRQGILRYWKEYAGTTTAGAFQRTVLQLTVGVSIVTAVLGLASLVVLAFFADRTMLQLCFLSVVAIVVFSVTLVHLSIWQADFTPALYAAAKIIATAGVFIGSLVLVSQYARNAIALSMGMTIGYTVAAIFGVLRLQPWFSLDKRALGHVDKQITARLFSYGLPFIGWFVGTQTLMFADRFILGIVSTASVVGVYAAMYTLINGLVSSLITPVLNAAHPAIVGAWADDSSHAAATVLKHYVRLFALVALPTIAGLTATNHIIAQTLVPDGYIPDGCLVVVLVIALFANMFGLFAHKGLEMAEQTKTMFGIVMVCAVLNMLLCALLIPMLAARGAALATLFSYLLYIVLSLRLSQQYLKVSINKGSLARIGLASVGVFCTALTLAKLTVCLAILVRLSIIGLTSMVVYVGLLFVLQELRVSDVRNTLVLGVRRLGLKVRPQF